MKFFWGVALAAVTIMTSCSKEEDGGTNNSGTKTLKLTINSGKFSRATEAPLADGLKTTITSLYVYFVDNVDPEVGGAVVLGSTELNASAIADAQSDGHEITGVSSSAKSVYVVANHTENGISLADPAGATIASIQAKLATMGDGKTTDWSQALLSNAPHSYATDNGLIGTVNGNNKANVAVSIMPSLSRIEVASLAADQTGTVPQEVKVSEFDLKGVYLNGYYPQFSVAGAPAGTPHVPTTVIQEAITDIPAWYKDVYGTALTGKTTYTAADGGFTAGNIWAYMLPAAAPRVIFHIDNIKYGTASTLLGRDQYLTVKSFKYASETVVGGVTHPVNTSVNFARGCIYKVNSVAFDLSKLRDNPNADNIDVMVTVTVLVWQGITVNPEF